MGRMKEEFMKMRMQEQEELMNGLGDIMEKHHPESHNENEYEKMYHQEMIQQEQLITNQNNLKMKKVNKVEEATMVKETKEETLKRLFLAHGLVKDDVYKDKRGFVIITRTGIDKIVSSMNIQVAYDKRMGSSKGYC